MGTGHDAYCVADPLFYDSPSITRGDDEDFPLARGPVPAGWRRTSLDDWLVHIPDGAAMPLQGWKIHASATLDDAEPVLATTWDYCVARGIPFKFVRSRQLLLLRNAKNADRGGSGKFVTIYPDEGALERVLSELGALLEGRRGPYVLSDLRWGAGPLYVRYGGYAERYCLGPDRELVLAIADASGQLVPDTRGPTFQLPEWVDLPAFLAPHLAARSAVTVEGLPYRIESALQFSNGGGLYGGVDTRTGASVVIKEARPHAGLGVDGTDAVARLERERSTLERLRGLEVVPSVIDSFELGEHRFLVLSFVEGTSLRAMVAERYPLEEGGDPSAIAEYASWAMGIDARLRSAVSAIHARGVVIGDLHPDNVLVQPDGELVLVDFEVASDAADAARPTLADPGFAAPRGRCGVDVDIYALACVRLFLFLPLTRLLALDAGKVEDLAGAIAQTFALPDGYLDDAVAVVKRDASPRAAATTRRRVEASRATWPAVRASIAGAIVASATPAREDRLFPGDVAQFDSPTGGLCLAHGAAGVLYALDATGAGRDPRFEEWLVERSRDPQRGSRLGLLDGLHGVAFALDHLGHRDEASRLIAICADELEGRHDRLGLDLSGGLSGIGLALLHLAVATGDASLLDGARRIAESVVDRLGAPDAVAEVSGGDHPYAGLTRGSSGPALFLVRLYQRTADPALLDLARTALLQDLRRCVARADGSLHVNEEWRTMPYLADGSAGIGFAIDAYASVRPDEGLERVGAAIRAAASAPFYAEPGLFSGRAGMVAYLSAPHPAGTAADRDPTVRAHIERLDWHAIDLDGRIAFPGDQLLRLSMDLATGSAGVLLALGMALHDTPVHLPLLGPLGGMGGRAHDAHAETKGGDSVGSSRSSGHEAAREPRPGPQRFEQGLWQPQRPEPAPLRLTPEEAQQPLPVETGAAASAGEPAPG